MSKRADWTEGVKRDNKNQIIVKKEWLEIRATEKRQLLIEGAEENIINKIKKLEARDNEVVKAVKKIKKTGVKVLRNNEWQIKNNLVLKEGKVYVLRNEQLRLEIIQLHHDTPIARYRE